MKTRWLALAMLLLGLQGQANAVDNDPGTLDDISGRIRVGTTTRSEAGRTYQCDVMRDYYYPEGDPDTNLGWASEPYVTNCIEVGSSSTDPSGCNPGDQDCECMQHPDLCRGGGPDVPADDEDECVCDGDTPAHKIQPTAKKGECGNKPGCRAKIKCKDCKADRDKNNQKSRDSYRRCIGTRKGFARDNCRAGRWRAGDPRTPVEDMRDGGRWETPRGAPVRDNLCHVEWDTDERGHRVRNTICRPSRDFEACVQTWMDDYPGHETASNGGIWGTGITGVGVGPVNIDFGGTTVTTNMEREDGYTTQCAKAQEDFRNKVTLPTFDKCAEQATKDEGRTCQ